MSYATGDSLKVRIRIAFGASIAANPGTWVWTDVTSWWHTPDDVQIGWGRSSGAEQPETSTLSLSLKNSDGRFTAYDPRSPYWPNVRKWTPISFDIDLGDGAGWRNRFSGFIRKWPLTWPGASSLMALAKIEAVGVLGRLSRGKPPARSPMRRSIAASGPVAYWPAEDGDAATLAGSALPGHAPLQITGTAAFASMEAWTEGQGYTVNYGSAALVDLAAGAIMSADLPPEATTATGTGAGWTVALAADVPPAANISGGDLALVEVRTGGTYGGWRLVITAAGFTQIQAWTGLTWTLVAEDNSVFVSMTPHNFAVWQSAPGVITAGYYWSSTGGWELVNTISGTVGGVTQVLVNPTGVTSTVPVPAGHLAVWAGHALPAVDRADGPLIRALYGYEWSGLQGSGQHTGEAATARLARLVAEDGLTLTMPAVDPADEQMMGLQKPGVPVALYQECETADQGLIYEVGFGLGYLPRSVRYNASVALTIDAAAGQLGMPFEPVDDDQMLRNRWTVQREDGASAAAADQQSIDRQGEIEATATLNLIADGPLPDQAGWRLHLSTAQEPRYPALSINLAAHPELAAAWCGCQPGSRIQVVNPPEQNVPGTVDQLVVGATETYRGRRSWKATLNVQPASPWDVATVDGEQRVAADGSTLAAALTAGGTSLLLSSTAVNGPWTQDPADFPLDVRVGGEQVTASAIAPLMVDQATRNVSSGWGTADTGQPWVTSVGAASDYSVTVGPPGKALMSLGSVAVLRTALVDVGFSDVTYSADVTLSTPTGAPTTAWVVARAVDVNTHYIARLEVAPGGATQLALFKRVAGTLSGLGAGAAVGTNSGDWRVVLDVHGSTLLAKAWRPAADAEPGWLISATDSAIVTGTKVGVLARLETGNTSTLPQVIRWDNLTVTNPQVVTLSARGVNGVTRAWPAGTEVDVWQPAILAL